MQLYTHQPGVRTRWATAENPQGLPGGACRGDDGRKRQAMRRDFRPGERQVLAEASGGSGMVRRIWVTIPDRSPVMLRALRLEMHWDGAAMPAVSAPLGDFFGQMLGRMCAFENELFSSPEGRSFCCVVPMPFRSGMRISVLNESQATVGMLFYEVDYTLGDAFAEGTLYFHSHWRRENPTRLRQDYNLLPQVRGRGQLGLIHSVLQHRARKGAEMVAIRLRADDWSQVIELLLRDRSSPGPRLAAQICAGLRASGCQAGA